MAKAAEAAGVEEVKESHQKERGTVGADFEVGMTGPIPHWKLKLNCNLKL